MKLIAAELKKLRQNRICLGCLVFLILVNLFLLWTNIRPLENRAPAAAYKKIASELDGLSSYEQYSFVKSRLDEVTALYKIDQIMRISASNSKTGAIMRDQNIDLFEKYGDLYEGGEYLRYASTLSQEYAFLSEIEYECEQVTGYDSFLDEISEKAELLSSISIFAATDNDNYAQQNIRQTAIAYEGMRGRQINYSPQKGIMTALNFMWTDVIAILGMVVLSSALVRQERDNGMLALIRSTPSGRLRTSLAKLAVLSIGLMILLSALYLVNLLYCGAMYGLGNLSRSVQSVPALMRSTLKVNVAEYILLFLLSKWVASFICGIWVIWACLITKRALTGYILAVGLPGISLLIRSLIPATSKLNVLKYANLISLMQNNELLGSYRNLYWFGSPIQLFYVEIITAILLGIAFTGIFCMTFVYAQLMPVTRKKARRRKSLFKTSTHFKSLSFYELHKIFFLCGVLPVMVCFVGFQIYETSIAENFITAQEIYYARYMKEIDGPVTTEKLSWLQEEGEKFKPLVQAQRALSYGDISSQQYQDILAANYSLQQEYGVYQQVVNKLYYIKEHPGAYFIYDTGYAKLFDYSGEQDSKDTLLAGFVATIIFSGIFSIEYSTDMQRVIRATKLGRSKLYSRKVGICSTIATAIAIFILVPRLYQVGSGYGFSAITAPLYSLTEYSTAPVSIPVFMLMFVSLVARIMAIWSTAMIMLHFSQRFRNVLSSIIVGGLVFCLPPLLNLYGLHSARWFSLYPLFHFGAMMQNTNTSIAAWFFLFIWISFGLEALYLVYDKWCSIE